MARLCPSRRGLPSKQPRTQQSNGQRSNGQPSDSPQKSDCPQKRKIAVMEFGNPLQIFALEREVERLQYELNVQREENKRLKRGFQVKYDEQTLRTGTEHFQKEIETIIECCNMLNGTSEQTSTDSKLREQNEDTFPFEKDPLDPPKLLLPPSNLSIEIGEGAFDREQETKEQETKEQERTFHIPTLFKRSESPTYTKWPKQDRQEEKFNLFETESKSMF